MNFMQVFKKLSGHSVRLYYKKTHDNVWTRDRKEFLSFMMEHEGDWYKSDEFADIFIHCPAVALPYVSRMFYGNGRVVRQGVNLSERVVECLKAAFEQFKKEQHTFPNALVTEMTMKAFGVEIEKDETESK